MNCKENKLQLEIIDFVEMNNLRHACPLIKFDGSKFKLEVIQNKSQALQDIFGDLLNILLMLALPRASV